MSAAELIDRLRGRAAFVRNMGGVKQAELMETAATRIASLEARVADLSRALEPFARFADVLDDSGDDEAVLDYASEPADSIYINLGHVRAARLALGAQHDRD